MRAGSLWHHSDFRKLWFGQGVSNFGDKISRVALPTVALLTLHGNAFDVGLLAALGTLPYVILGPIAGVLADRVARRAVLIIADTVRMLSLASVPLAYSLHRLTIGQLFAVTAVNGVLTVFFEVSYQSFLPDLVGPDSLIEGNSKLQFSRSFAEVGGTAVGGALIQGFGAAVGVLVDAGTFLVSMISLAAMRPRPRPDRTPVAGAPPLDVLTDMRQGLAFIMADRRLRTLMTTTGLVNLGAAAGTALILVFAYGPLKLHPAEVGLALGASGLGLLAGASAARPIAAHLTIGWTLIVAIVICGLSYLAIGLAQPSDGIWILAAGYLALGAANSLYNIHVLSLVGAITPGAVLGRVSGTALTVVNGGGALGALLGGIVGTTVGLRPTMVGSGVLVLAAVVLIFFSPVRSDGARLGAAAAPDPAAVPAAAGKPAAAAPGPRGSGGPAERIRAGESGAQR
jgi:predicted MFS family arabinose efflux permease